MRFITHTSALAVLCLGLLACGGTPTYNPTVFNFEIKQEYLAENPIKTVVIPHVNLGGPSRIYLEKVAPRIDAQVGKYLKEHGYKVLPQRDFKQHWNTAVRAYGTPFDPTTGKVNRNAYNRIIISVRDQLQKKSMKRNP